MNKWRIANIIALISVAAVFVFTDQYWSQICAVQGCDMQFRRGILTTWNQVSFYALIFLIPFLALPVRFFQKYCLYVVSWLLPVSGLLIASTKPIPGGFLSWDRQEVVNAWAVAWAIITIGFIIYHWYKGRKTNQL